MALIKCPECGKQMSDMAGSCPHCGYTKMLIKIIVKNLNQTILKVNLILNT